jgi:serine/threonine-protein kinase
LARGRDVSAAELCRDHPELAPELERRIRAVRQINGLAQADNVTVPLSTAALVNGGAEGHPDPLPSVVGYELLGKLGRGGMGVVYLARDTRLGRVVALKMILAGAPAAAPDRARIQPPAEAIARVQPPNIGQIFEVGQHEGHP